MDNKKVISPIWIFLIGVIVGGLIIYLAYFMCNKSCKQESNPVTGTEKPKVPLGQGFEQISLDTARAYYKCYMKSSLKIKADPIVAFSVNRGQLNAMNYMLENDSTITRFRIYMGVYGDPELVSMVVSVDEEGDNTENIYKTAPGGPCPDQCDLESDIVTPDK